MNILKLFKGAQFDYDQRKEENVIRNWNFKFFLFLTTLIFKPRWLCEQFSSFSCFMFCTTENARSPGIFCFTKALRLGIHFGAKAPGCPGGDGCRSKCHPNYGKLRRFLRLVRRLLGQTLVKVVQELGFVCCGDLLTLASQKQLHSN